jgi:hypothetical protein
MVYGRVSTVLPAIAFILTIYGEFYLFFLNENDIQSFFQAGLLGIVYFVTNILFQTLSRQLQKRQTEVFTLEQINQLVIGGLPTGVVVSCQNEKSQLQNREQAMRILRARLLAVAEDTAAKEASDIRRSQVRTVDRSERIRTYNFPENRLNDHRVGFKSHNLDQILDGDLDAVIEACMTADQQSRLAEPSA